MAKNIRSKEIKIENNLLREVAKELRNIYGDKLKKIILYGSYARKSNVEGSDIDIMVLVDMEPAELKKLQDKVLDISIELTTRYGMVISIIDNNYNYFYQWVDALPFFNNVNREGVVIYGG